MIPAWLPGRILYPLQERLLGRPTYAYLQELERTQWWSREELEQLQLRKLTALLRSAWEHCPWHRARLEATGWDPEQPLSFEDFRRLPTMDKADARTHRDALVWKEVPGGAHAYTTGGSSGQPLIFYYGRRRQASDAAGRMRARRWWGLEPGTPEVFLWGSPVELSRTDRIKVLRDRAFNQLVLNAFAMSAAAMDGYGHAIQSYQPHCIYGYASSLALLSAHLRERGKRLRLPTLKVVCTTGEPLFPHQRDLIQEVFGVPVAIEYGSRDAGFLAHDNPGGELLQLSESNIIEVLDDRGHPVAPGQVGEAVVTGLESWAQPFVRYRTGDMVRLAGEPASDGRGLHRLESVEGRKTDFLVRADGTIMHALAGIYVLRETPGVGEFKLIQHHPEVLEVQVVPTGEWQPENVQRIETGLRNRLGATTQVHLRLVEAIAPEASGKHRYVVSHVPLPGGLATAAPQPPMA